MQELHAIAAMHVGSKLGAMQARELVGDITCDLLDGKIDCGGADSLPETIRGEIASRAKHYRSPVNSVSLSVLERSPTSALLDDESDEPPRDAVQIVEAIGELARAAKDTAVLELLALHRQDVSRRISRQATGMSPGVYRAARNKLIEYARAARSANIARTVSQVAVVSPADE